MTPLGKAIKAAGSARALACKLGVSPMSISYWQHRSSGMVPAERVIRVFEVTGVTPHELRPDLYPNPTDGMADLNRSAPSR
ncbi:transcriptional regulator [Erwinia aphidicola]|uniref:transcriptional regulator n=1 Tax=Erwinia aphidicola TaxID=68334 RepID=UPI00209EB64E|nr:YdaS family helix-turn-helix protein [Erwinia aphidicola]